MQLSIVKHPVMERLRGFATLVGVGEPIADETVLEYGSRILTAIDPEDEYLDDEIRFRVLVLINQRGS